ncbi:uncharacterized protein LOC143034827 [Oratosquilla oratoria]|uniref:uncharacterized protein LOC143034827 n=1 Tax=Oratosquilla oratoria TaxID=337810 RepID=UPI003F769070
MIAVRLSGNKTPDHLVEENWNQLKETIITTCEETIGRKKRKHQDWFDDNDETLKELIDQKRKAYITLQNEPKSATKRELFKKCKAAVQRTTRTLKNQWWREKPREILQLADANNTRGFFNAMKEIYGPSTYGQALLKSKDETTILKSNTEIGDRWSEHFNDLLNHKATIDKSILDMIPEEAKDYSLTRIPSLEEVKIAITAMKNNKAADPDGIPAEIYKLGGDIVQHQFHQLLVKIWTNEVVPSDFRDANIITIYKRKGDRSECGNYRGISLLATAGKILARILNNRLKTLSERILPETQAGFRPSRITTDMIFAQRQLQEKCREQHQPLYLAFSWEDRRTNVSVLQEAKMTSIEAYVIKGQLRWSGHVVRMTDERLPKQIFYSQLKDGKRTKGGQKKRYKDSLKTNLKKCNIDFINWEETVVWL